jgi:rhamnosyltransferase subunit B
MRCLLAVLGTHGDVLPFIALGSALVRRGHEVLLNAPAPFERHAVRAGLAFHALGTQADFDRLVREPDLWHPRRGARLAFRYALERIPDIYHWIEAHRTEDCVVVASSSAFGARVAQDRLGTRLVTLHVLPMMLESRVEPPRLPGVPLPEFLPAHFRNWIGRGAYKVAIEPFALPQLNAFRESLGLPPVRRLAHWWNSPTRMLLMFPDWYAPPQPDWPRQAVQLGFPMSDGFGDALSLGPDVTDFLDRGDPPLAFTYGSGMRQGRRFFETAIELCRLVGRRGILLAPQSGQVRSDLPDDVIHVPYAPFGKLLPRCAALIHHGGIGTVAQAMAAGIPQLVVPVAFDHFDEARRLRRLNLGTSMTRWQFTPTRAARRVRRLLADTQIQNACHRARTRLKVDDSLQAACDLIEASG